MMFDVFYQYFVEQNVIKTSIQHIFSPNEHLFVIRG